MGDLFRRLGAAGLSIVLAALIFGFLAGGIVLNRYIHPAAQITAQQQQEQKEQQEGAPKQGEQGDQNDEQGGQKEKADPEDSHATKARVTEPDTD